MIDPINESNLENTVEIKIAFPALLINPSIKLLINGIIN